MILCKCHTRTDCNFLRRTFPQKSSYTAFGGPRALTDKTSASDRGSTALSTSDLDGVLQHILSGEVVESQGGEDASMAFLNDPLWDEIDNAIAEKETGNTGSAKDVKE